jgi:hypothetical protein
MARFFGFEFGKNKQKEQVEDGKQSFVLPDYEDGTYNTESTTGLNHAYKYNFDSSFKNEADLITKYREMAMHPEAEFAIDEVVNEAITFDSNRAIQIMVGDDLIITDKLKAIITREFENIYNMFDFNRQGYEIFRRWYIDGRIYFHKVIDINDPEDGIQEIRPIDPRQIKKIREFNSEQDEDLGVSLVKNIKEYFLYSESGFQPSAPHTTTENSAGIKLTFDSICYVNSGLADSKANQVIGYMHKALKPFNQLRMIEDAIVIYRISRAPERRVFYIDVGNLPKMKAEQYLNNLMVRFKNKLVYDAETGDVKDDRKFTTMMEDYWLPRRDGGRGTEISTLPAGQNLGELEDVKYFREKLFRSLNIPVSRLETTQGFNLGRSAEITRDEFKFSKFVDRLRMKFSTIFTDCLGTQLRLRGYISEDEWDIIKYKLQFRFNTSSYFNELKDNEILKDRIDTANQLEPFVNKYYSETWIRRNIFKISDAEFADMRKDFKEAAAAEGEEGALGGMGGDLGGGGLGGGDLGGDLGGAEEGGEDIGAGLDAGGGAESGPPAEEAATI